MEKYGNGKLPWYNGEAVVSQCHRFRGRSISGDPGDTNGEDGGLLTLRTWAIAMNETHLKWKAFLADTSTWLGALAFGSRDINKVSKWINLESQKWIEMDRNGSFPRLAFENNSLASAVPSGTRIKSYMILRRKPDCKIWTSCPTKNFP